MEVEHTDMQRLLAKARDGLSSNGQNIFLSEILEALFGSTRVHTFTENLLMRLYEYPDREHHIEEHEVLDAMALEIWDAYKLGDKELSLRKLTKFTNFLNKHIDDEDERLSRYLTEIGATAA